MNSTTYFINQKAEKTFPSQKHVKIFIVLHDDGCEFLKIRVCYFVVQFSLTHGLQPVHLQVIFLMRERERCMLGTLGLTGVCYHTWFYMGLGGRDPTLVWQVLLYTEMFSQH